MGYASLYAKTAKKRAPTIAQEKTLAQDKGVSIGQSDNKEAVFQFFFDEAREEIRKVYLPGTMAYLKVHNSKLYDEVLL